MDSMRSVRGLLLIIAVFAGLQTHAAKSSKSECETDLGTTYSLNSFFEKDPEKNLAVSHPFTIANAAEKTYAMIMHVPPRKALDPLYRVKPVTIYPMLAGEHEAAGGRMVVGQESSVDAFVGFVASVARGDRNGKTLGFPGPAGTGKTELLYVLSNIERNLASLDQYRQYSYRFKGVDEIPYLHYMFKRGPDKKPLTPYLDPDMPRSPFTLLREDMQKEVLASAKSAIAQKWNITISDGWTAPEPKTAKVLEAIFAYEEPDIASGKITIDDLSRERYLEIINKYIVVVPKSLLQPRPVANVVRAQTDNPNYQALFASPNIARAAYYGLDNALGIDYRGLVFRQDGGLLMIDELFRNPPEFLNILLEVVQNHIAQTDFGDPVLLDVLPIWNSNDESIEQARENAAIKALLDRTDRRAMRLVLPPAQIEAVSIFQLGKDRFKQRKLADTALTPLDHSEVYPAVDKDGKVYPSQGRYALYYDLGDKEILISPYTLAYMSWVASATRFVTDMNKLNKFSSDLNLITSNQGLFSNPVDRVRINIGDKQVERAELMDLARVKDLAKEGAIGISSRDIETWLKEAIKLAKERNKGVLTPMMIDQVFQQLLDEGGIEPPKEGIRADWLTIRKVVKLTMLLPKLDQDIKAIVSGDGQKAERIYDEIEREFIARAADEKVVKVIPEDGSHEVIINDVRLKEVREIYRQKFGRDFQPNFLLRNLHDVRRGGPAQRNSDLLEAVRIFISRHESATADYISAFDSFYRGDNVDPSVRQKVAEVEPHLSSYGYDVESFKEAVSFLAQLQREAELERRKQQ